MELAITVWELEVSEQTRT